MNTEQETRLRARINELDAAGARLGLSHPTDKDRELELCCRILNRQRATPGRRTTAGGYRHREARFAAQHRPDPQAYGQALTMSLAHE